MVTSIVFGQTIMRYGGRAVYMSPPKSSGP
jgi:hypothetical protein